jgi:glycosyltransferase involved in cell wall biosynthesis
MSPAPPRIVHTFLKYPPAIGGMEIYVQGLCEGLRTRGYDARVVTSNLRVHTGGGVPLDRAYAEVGGVPVTRLEPERPLTRRVVLPELYRTLEALAPDLVHTHDLSRHAFEASAAYARDHRVPLFVTGLHHEVPGHPTTPARAGQLRRAVASIPEGSRVFFNTAFEPEALAEHAVRFDPRRVTVDFLPPSIDPVELESIPTAEVPELAVRPDDAIVVAFVGRLQPLKGIDRLIEAFAEALRRLTSERDERARRLHLAIAGFCDSDVDYETHAARLGIAERVTVLVDRPRRDVVNLLRASRIFAFPSRCETFGIVVLEAWATENLVLVSNHGALPRVVEDGVTGRVIEDEDWADRLVDAVRQLDTDPVREMIRRGRETALRRFDRSASLDRYIGFVEEALAR